MADWLKILDEQTRLGDEMARDVPSMLSDPDIGPVQVGALFKALEKQAAFAEDLKAALEKLDYDFDVVDAADRLADRYVELAASAAEKLKTMRGA